MPAGSEHVSLRGWCAQQNHREWWRNTHHRRWRNHFDRVHARERSSSSSNRANEAIRDDPHRLENARPLLSEKIQISGASLISGIGTNVTGATLDIVLALQLVVAIIIALFVAYNIFHYVLFLLAGSTGRCNTGVKSLSWGFKLQGLTWSFV
jgi:hypothetical protein